MMQPGGRTHRIDGLLTHGHYAQTMHRFWLILLMAFAMVTSGYSAAVAGPACPMHSSASASHDCCDEHGDKGGRTKSMDGCMMGQTCRAPPTVMPSLEPISLAMTVVVIDRPILQPAAAPDTRPGEFWRPPRTV